MASPHTPVTESQSAQRAASVCDGLKAGKKPLGHGVQGTVYPTADDEKNDGKMKYVLKTVPEKSTGRIAQSQLKHEVAVFQHLGNSVGSPPLLTFHGLCVGDQDGNLKDPSKSDVEETPRFMVLQRVETDSSWSTEFTTDARVNKECASASTKEANIAQHYATQMKDAIEFFVGLLKAGLVDRDHRFMGIGKEAKNVFCVKDSRLVFFDLGWAEGTPIFPQM